MSLTAHHRLFAGSALLAFAAFMLTSIPVRAVERSLVGIAIYSPAQQIIRKYGNPTYVLTGGQTLTGSSSASASAGASGAGIGPLPPLAPPAAQTMPELGGGRGRGAYAPPSVNSAYTGQQTTQQTDIPGEVTYVYQEHNGTTYQFLLAPNGKVIQITALGYKPQSARTSRGIALGSTYSQVLAKYGNPESINSSGGVTLLTYTQRAHVAFQLVSNKVVGINVAAIQ